MHFNLTINHQNVRNIEICKLYCRSLDTSWVSICLLVCDGVVLVGQSSRSPASLSVSASQSQHHHPRLHLIMEDNEGIGYIFGLSTVLFGLTFIMSMGVYSAHHPYKPGKTKLQNRAKLYRVSSKSINIKVMQRGIINYNDFSLRFSTIIKGVPKKVAHVC